MSSNDRNSSHVPGTFPGNNNHVIASGSNGTNITSSNSARVISSPIPTETEIRIATNDSAPPRAEFSSALRLQDAINKDSKNAAAAIHEKHAKTTTLLTKEHEKQRRDLIEQGRRLKEAHEQQRRQYESALATLQQKQAAQKQEAEKIINELIAAQNQQRARFQREFDEFESSKHHLVASHDASSKDLTNRHTQERNVLDKEAQELARRQETERYSLEEAARKLHEKQERERLEQASRARSLAVNHNAERIALEEAHQKLLAQKEADVLARKQGLQLLIKEQEAQKIYKEQESSLLVKQHYAQEVAKKLELNLLKAQQDAELLAHEQQLDILAKEQETELLAKDHVRQREQLENTPAPVVQHAPIPVTVLTSAPPVVVKQDPIRAIQENVEFKPHVLPGRYSKDLVYEEPVAAAEGHIVIEKQVITIPGAEFHSRSIIGSAAKHIRIKDRLLTKSHYNEEHLAPAHTITATSQTIQNKAHEGVETTLRVKPHEPQVAHVTIANPPQAA